MYLCIVQRIFNIICKKKLNIFSLEILALSLTKFQYCMFTRLDAQLRTLLCIVPIYILYNNYNKSYYAIMLQCLIIVRVHYSSIQYYNV